MHDIRVHLYDGCHTCDYKLRTGQSLIRETAIVMFLIEIRKHGSSHTHAHVYHACVRMLTLQDSSSSSGSSSSGRGRKVKAKGKMKEMRLKHKAALDKVDIDFVHMP